MADFTVDGIAYRSRKMPARTQAHVLRRLAPIIDPVYRLMSSGGMTDDAVGAFAKGFADLEDEQLDYVMDHCLSVVQRKQGEAWANFMGSDGKTPIFQDVDLTVHVQIIANVLRDNYEPLFQKALVSLKGGGNLSA